MELDDSINLDYHESSSSIGFSRNFIHDGVNFILIEEPDDWCFIELHEIKQPPLTQSVIIVNNKLTMSCSQIWNSFT